MDWPGAEELSERLKKTIDPKLLSEDDEDPALAAAKQQIDAMNQQMQQMHDMLQNVSKSMESQELKIKAYDAETKRMSAVQAGMSEEQIQDIVMGTLHAAITSGDLVGEMPQREQMPIEQPQEGQLQ